MNSPTPASFSVSNLWTLRADPAAVDAASRSWRSLAAAAETAGDRVDRADQNVDPWAGDTEQSWREHRYRLTGDLRSASGTWEQAGLAMEAIAGTLRSAQRMLDDSWESLATISSGANGELIMFIPRTEAEAQRVRDEIRAATEIRDNVDLVLDRNSATLAQAATELAALADRWQTVTEGSADPFSAPPEVDTTVILDPDTHQMVVDTGPGDDQVKVTIDPKTGRRMLAVNGVEYPIPNGAELTIRAGAGNDTITIPPNAHLKVTLLGGDGNDLLKGGGEADRILGGRGDDNLDGGDGSDYISGGLDTDTSYGRGGNDLVLGGTGRDYVDGGKGDDLLDGGSGDDTGYGLSGNDRLRGGLGNDYLEGATGRDLVNGGFGNDALSGGRDDDTIHGGAGDDHVYTGCGTDTVTGGDGQDTVYGQRIDHSTEAETTINVEVKDLATYLKVEGSDEFKERVNADLDLLRASPTGQKMLGALEGAHDDSKHWFYGGNGLTITETTDANSYAYSGERPFLHDHPHIEYNPSFNTLGYDGDNPDDPNSDPAPPVAILYHEMAHIYDSEKDTTVEGEYNGQSGSDRMPDDQRGIVNVPNSERQAVGLPIDHDRDPNTPNQVDPDHPVEYTENGIHDEIGIHSRDTYGFR